MKKFNLIFLLSLFCLFFCDNCPAQIQPVIATLDFNVSEGISPAAAMALTNIVNSELLISNKYVVVERQKMREILEEQGFQMSGCTSSSCAVEVGRGAG